MKPAFLFLFIIWFADAELKPRKGRGVVCTFKNKTYNLGDSWHPYLEPFGLMYCMRCVCAETGHVKCSTIRCPAPSCDNPVVQPQQCCPRCTDEPKFPAALRASVKTCRYNGTIYQPGESFTKQDLFPSRHRNQCVLCTCSNGNIFCGLKTCPLVPCSSPVPAPDTCCLLCKDHSGSASSEDGNQQLNRGVRHSVDQCPGEQTRMWPDRATVPRVRTSPQSLSKLNLKGASETTVKILLQRKHQRACLYNGKTYSHGDIWHPVLGKVLECILCTCTDGLQDCKRITCPSQYPCKHPTKSPGKCCKTCPETRAASNQTQCHMGHRSTILVYKVESPLNVDNPERMKIIAAERQSEVEVLMWRSVEGVLQLMEMEDVQRKDIKDHPKNHTLLTTINEETWRRFKEEARNLSKASQTVLCVDGILEIVKYLNPRQTEGLCSP
ncbi:chordin-like protein 2 [Boleophthalmus pectinirostris]|uniref:chordin-like protein 2 n=1 Tax=Boleophthalmus pectinirostris TaxID=150288 RepID=UPI000A1C38EC|nr:chordin-like protein 2 [Boleophthalmus pectinirostris]